MRKVFSVLGMALMLGIGAISSGVYGEFIAAKAAEEETEVVTVEAPRVSNATGAYTEEFDLTVTVPEGCTVYYTLDGSNPVNSSTRITYTSPIAVKDRTGDPNYVTAVDPALFDCAYATYDSENNVMTDTYSAPDDDKVDKATVVRAVACDSEGNYSTVTTNTYFVGSMADHIKGIKESCEAAGVPLSIMSISVNYEDLFDYETGIYVKGKVFEEAFAEVSKPKRRKNIVDETRKLPANYNQKGKEWEREAHIDYIESDGTNTSVKLQQDCGIRIQGNYSRSDLQKSFRLYARSEYGGKNFKYPFFGDDAKDSEGNTLAKFKKLVLRNGGNDAFITKYRDSYWQNLLKDMKNDTLASRVCVVYIDGEYWGVYVLQEDYGDDYMEDHHGVTKDNVVSYKGDAEKYPVIGYEMDDGTLPEGIDDYTYFMKDVNHFFYTHTKCVSQEDYDALAALFDPESVMEYFAVQAWVNNKWDWPGKNWYMWMTTEGAKEENVYTDGRWRHVYCDLDFGGWSGAGEAYNNTISNSGLLDVNKTNQVVRAFAYFMTNDNFRAQYKALLDSLDDEGGPFYYDTMVAAAEKMHGTYYPLLEQFYERYVSKTVDGDSRVEKFYGDADGVLSSLKGYAGARPKNVASMLSYVDSVAKEYDQIPEPSYEPTPDPYEGLIPSPSAEASAEPSATAEPGASATAEPGVSTEPSAAPGESASPSSSSEPSASPDTTKKTLKLKLTVPKTKKKLTIKSDKKAKLVIKFSKKVYYKDGKKYKKVKKITIKAAKNKKGKIVIKFKKKLKKGFKITVTSSLSGAKKSSKLTIKK